MKLQWEKLRLLALRSRRNHLQYMQDVLCPPSLLARAGGMRRLRRSFLRALNRKSVIALALFVLIYIAILHTIHRIPYHSLWLSKSSSSCSKSRSNPHDVAPPKPVDTATLKQLWADLEGLFDAHPPSPTHLDTPRHKSDHEFPTEEQLASFFTLTDKQAASTRASHGAVLRELASYPLGNFSGRGVVMLAGGRFSEYAATSLGVLREVGSQLPVEVWIKDDTEDTPGWCEELQSEGMACRHLSDYMDPAAVTHVYAMKILTLLFSSFEEILFLDADSAPIQNPDALFESGVYLENGVILWPDYWQHTGSPWLPYVTGLSDSKSNMLYGERSVESGQIIWNKKRHWKSLLLATYYNYWGPNFYYTLLNNGWSGWGDKETFAMALRASDEPCLRISQGIMTVFLSGTELGIGMMQANPINTTVHNPMFLHSNMVKWSMREFSCIGCDDQLGYSSHYHLEDAGSLINMHLKEGIRIFNIDFMEASGIDPEPLFWKSIEHTACRSAAWGHPQACKQTRNYIKKTFGYAFRKSDFTSIFGSNNDYCLVDPQ